MARHLDNISWRVVTSNTLLRNTYSIPRKRSWQGYAGDGCAGRTQRTGAKSAMSLCHKMRDRSSHAAGVSPAAALVFGVLWRSPFPRPFECHRLAPAGAVVAHELDIGVLVEVWIGLELSSYESLDFARGRRIDICEAVDLCIGRGERFCTVRGRCQSLLRLSDHKREGKDELVVI